MENKIKENLKQAMVSRNEIEVSTLRLLLSEINNLRIQKRAEQLEESDIISVVQRELKKRKEAVEGYRKGNREELAQKEEAEAKVLEKYLPEQLSDEELTKIVEDFINNIGAKSLADMGRVIGTVMGKVGQGASGSRVSALVKEKLSA